jgi:hypothetical protein
VATTHFGYRRQQAVRQLNSYPTECSAIEAKFRVAGVLQIPTNCVEHFKARTHVRRAQ